MQIFGAGPWVPAPVGSWLAGERGLVPKLVWRGKRGGGAGAGRGTEAEVAGVGREEGGGRAGRGGRL